MHHYSLSGYGSMIADDVRLPAYRRALEKAIKPGDVVADIGTGPGVMAVIACRLGAGHVYAIEPNDAIQVAREVAVANGLQDRITFFQEITTKITPPRRAQVLVSDLRGVVPLWERHIPTVVDARERWMAPGGLQIPQRDWIHGALVESEKSYNKGSEPWRKLGGEMNLEPVRRRTINNSGKCWLLPEHLLSSARLWAELDYRVIADPNVSNRLEFTATRAGTAHGFALWFDTELFEGIGFSNAPGQPELVYSQLFFPFTEPVPVQAGEIVAVDLRARLVDDNYVWQWTTEWTPSGPERGKRVRYQQSTFFGGPVSPDRLRRSEQGHRPVLNAEGRLERTVLEGMTGGLTLVELSRQIAAAHPQRFANEKEALAYVSELAVRFSE
jgi:protein arginine N-methyltransferase 1